MLPVFFYFFAADSATTSVPLSTKANRPVTERVAQLANVSERVEQ